MKYKCIIFDCDGTLVDTVVDIAIAMNRSLTSHGFPDLPLEKYRNMVSWGIVRLTAMALPEKARTKKNIQSIAIYARQFMINQTQEQSLAKPYPGIKELVMELSMQKKIFTAVLSNKDNAALLRLMNDLFGLNAFDVVCGLQPGIAPKPDPSATWEILAEVNKNPHDTIFLGDSEIDMATARNAGCYPLGASWGFRSRAALEKAGAAQIIDKPNEIWELVVRK